MAKKQLTDLLLSWGKTAQKLRVSVGTLIGILFLIWMHPSYRSLWLGGSITCLGAALRMWAAGHIDKGRVLAQSGPYALTRNPLYLGSFLMALGIIVAGQGYLLLLPFVLLFTIVYYPVMKAEELELQQSHGQEFMSYSNKVPIFFPTLRVSSGPPSFFLWTRMLRNREHHTFAVLVLIEIVLFLRVH